MRALIFSVLALATSGAASGKTASDLQVTAVRFWTLGDVTRVAIEVNGDFTFKRDRLNNPDRLFFDIIEARPNVDGLRFSTRQVNDKLLKQIRVAETLPGRTRVVLDLNNQVEYTVSKLENPDRLMIELRSTVKKSDPAPTVTTSTLPAPPFLRFRIPRQYALLTGGRYTSSQPSRLPPPSTRWRDQPFWLSQCVPTPAKPAVRCRQRSATPPRRLCKSPRQSPLHPPRPKPQVRRANQPATVPAP